MDRRKVITMRKPVMEKAKHVHLEKREGERRSCQFETTKKEIER